MYDAQGEPRGDGSFPPEDLLAGGHVRSNSGRQGAPAAPAAVDGQGALGSWDLGGHAQWEDLPLCLTPIMPTPRPLRISQTAAQFTHMANLCVKVAMGGNLSLINRCDWSLLFTYPFRSCRAQG